MEPKISIIGGGSWGTALALILGEKGYAVRLWIFESELAETLNRSRENTTYLPGIHLPSGVTCTSSVDEAVEGTNFVIFAVPSHVARPVLMKLAPIIPENASIVIATKGIENETLMLMSEMAKDVLDPVVHAGLAVISGPSFAREVCSHHPTAVVLALSHHAPATRLQEILTTPHFKVYTSPDMIGVQLGGALKNIIALAAGGVDGLGFGNNTRAALISRGLAEMMRLGKAMGAEPKTFSGLSGAGDLILTCTGGLSRNRTVGYKIGQGEKLQEILGPMKMVAEGVETTRAAFQLARKYGVRMPIVEQTYAVLYEGKNPRHAVNDLMESVAGEEIDA